ncbi:hypothetical protein PAHAL_8G163500 [Panicum hallii]|uniref:Uncharacterized protein n=1 Tax=Panicum hallii TaxID=206008 RepID=A0A2T8I944_9POAL|nr:hypothetical protein PAHAL_8G163500 [Panicum hallii]
MPLLLPIHPSLAPHTASTSKALSLSPRIHSGTATGTQEISSKSCSLRDIMKDTAAAIVNSTAAVLNDASSAAYSSPSSSTHSASSTHSLTVSTSKA